MKKDLNIIRRILNVKHLICVAILTSLFSTMASADNIRLANKPLVDSTTSDVLPNLMFILDNSGSMAFKFTPDWVDDSPYGANPILFRNPTFNTQFYSPSIKYTPPVDYTGASLPSQTTWTSVNNNAFRTGDGQSNLVNNSNYYAFIAGEYCTAQDLTNCTTSNTPTGLYIFPASIRWCNTAANAIAASPAAGVCKAIRVTGFTNLRMPSSTSTITFSTTSNSSVSSIIVGGKEILANTTANTNNTSTMATNVTAQINACTNGIVDSCQINGYSATRSGAVVTILSPYGSASVSLSPLVTKSGSMSAASTAFVLRTPGSLSYIDINSTVTSYTKPGSAVKASERTDCSGSVCTYNEEMTNYANWFTYYQTRMQGMKSAASLAFKGIDSRYRVGFITINNPGTNYVPIAKYELGVGKQKQLWYTKLFSIVPGSGTPLRSALSTVGRIYAGKKPVGSADPVEYACQKNFSLLTTDGYWNTDATADVKDVNGNAIGNLDGGTSTPRPLYEGPNASSASLADTAKYYYDTDLRTTTFNNCIGALGQNVCGEGAGDESILKQNMTTLTLGLGIDGTLQYSGDYKAQTSGDFANIKAGSGNWPVPVADTESAIDDLWHAAVNANGTYFSARDPKQLTDALKKALSDIQVVVGAGSAASASSLQPTSGDNFNYVASYSTTKWIGNLEARTVDLNSFETSQDALWCVEDVAADACAAPATILSENSGSSNKFYCKTSSSNASACDDLGGVLTGTDCKVEISTSCTGTMAAKVVSGRNIKFNSGGTLTAFTYGALNSSQKARFEKPWLSANLTQWVDLTSTAGGGQEKAVGDGIVNYLKGQKNLEDRTSNVADDRLFRYREATLGDITESQPAYIAKPVFSYADAGYDAFKTAQSARVGTVYVGANDGMLHAFRASNISNDADNGKEIWAFVPTPVIPNMWKLADRDYATGHLNYVNGDPVISDICVSNCVTGTVAGDWRTVLMGGLSGGGRGYYAIDITDPTDPKLLWEFTSANQSNLGYTFGTPVVTKLNDGTWVALLTSGYNNGSVDSDGATANSPSGNGQGYLYVVNANTGAVLKTFSTGTGTTTTPSGLAQITPFGDDGNKNNLATYTYGGDLLGNLWRFDINAATGTAPILLATLKGPSNLAQPITTRPDLGVINKKRVVFVGTGKYLEVADLSNLEQQTLYAIKDDNLSGSLGNPRSSLIQQTIVTTGDKRSVDTTTVLAVDFNTDLGWRVDFPEAGERMNIDSYIANGVLLAPTVVPASTSCSPGGHGWFNYFNYKTGGGVANLGGIVSEKLNSPAVGFNLVYDSDGKPVITVVEANNPTPHKIDNSDVARTGAARTTIFDKNIDNTYGRKSIWRELTR